ncbi:MAG TPA: class I SAM-dependent methyltransferase [Gemmatimonadales bacterium]
MRSSPAYELASCPGCGSDHAEEIASADEIREEVELLWEFHTDRLRPDTPPPHLIDRVAFSQQPPLRVVRCAECGLVYRNPRERDFELRDSYAGEEPDRDALAALHETQRATCAGQVERLGEVAGRAGRVLEVGSYVGGFLAAAGDAGWQAEGLDVNPVANTFARELGLRVTEGDLESFAGPGGFDAVALWNCFDQLPDPGRAAHRAHSLLADGGVIAIRVPNGAFYAAVRQRLAGPGARLARLLLAHNNLLGFPYRHGFTLESLEHLLARTGFTVERVYGDALVPIADEWTQGWAALEERVVKGALRLIAKGEAEAAPWIEVYGRRVGGRR